jgi:hypothetical protein
MIVTVFVAQKESELWLVINSLPIEFTEGGIERRNDVWVVYDLVIVTTGRGVAPNKVVASPQANSPVGKVLQDSEAAAAAGSLRTRAVARAEIRSAGLKIVWYFILLECSRRSLVWSSSRRSFAKPQCR